MSDGETQNMGKDDVERRDEDQDELPDIDSDQSVDNEPDYTGKSIRTELTQFIVELNNLPFRNVLYNCYEMSKHSKLLADFEVLK